MAEKLERVFMITKRSQKISTYFSVLTAYSVMLFSAACTPDLSDANIPFSPFSPIQINLNLPAYNALRTNGGYKYIDGGVRGIILYHKSNSEYLAFERNCSYHPNDACATVEVHISTLYMLDPCCNSTFDFLGKPSGGVAWRPLRQYEVLVTGTDLTITDTILP
jgi:hypothetical protein